MQTTGLAEATIGRLYEGERLAQALREARERTLHVYAHLDLEKLAVPRLPIVNPPLWELAHVGWFQEHWCLRYSAGERAVVRDSILSGADAMFDSAAVAHATRWSLPYPPAKTLRGYMEDTLDATLTRIEQRGYGFVPLARARRDPAYASPDGYIGRAGPSWLLRWARSLRIRTSVGGQPDPEPWLLKRYEEIQARSRPHSED